MHIPRAQQVGCQRKASCECEDHLIKRRAFRVSRETEEYEMPMIDADGCLLNVSVEGRDSGPTLMLSNSLGCTLQMWEPQMKALTRL